MKQVRIVSFVLALSGTASLLTAQDAPQPQPPAKEHQWLQQLVGTWETRGEAVVQPGQAPITCEGAESVRAIGGLWTVSESKSTFMGVPITGVMTLGYDPQKKKFLGTWIDSTSSYMWKYEGALAGDVLTLETEGPSPHAPGQMAKYREAIELKSKDHKVFTSSILTDDGKWQTFVTFDGRRKK